MEKHLSISTDGVPKIYVKQYLMFTVNKIKTEPRITLN